MLTSCPHGGKKCDISKLVKTGVAFYLDLQLSYMNSTYGNRLIKMGRCG
jgi:hypothetical protein